METALALLAILGAIAVGAVSPGPSFVLVVRIAVAQSRRAGLAAALGMGVGGVLLGGLALLGLTALIAQVGWLHAGLKLAGGAYLLWLAWSLWQGAARPLDLPAATPAPHGAVRAFWLALATQLSNPKAAVVYGGIFAALLPAAPADWAVLVLPPGIFAVELGWYALVALAFSAARPRAVYLRGKRVIDRTAGSVMGLLGARLIADAARPAV